MKHKPSEYPFSKCLACGGLVVSELQIGEERKKFIYENATSKSSLVPRVDASQKNTEPNCGFSCQICGIFYIFPPPLDKKRWDMAKKIFLDSLSRENTDSNEPIGEKK